MEAPLTVPVRDTKKRGSIKWICHHLLVTNPLLYFLKTASKGRYNTIIKRLISANHTSVKQEKMKRKNEV